MDTTARSATVIAALNLKGGVGKTHSCWLLGSVAQERSARTLLVDLDSQGNLTSSFLATGDDRPGVERLFDVRFEPQATPLIRRTAYEHLDLIPSSPLLSSFDESKQEVWESKDLHLSLREGLRAILKQYDLIVLDCPPRLSLVSMAALTAADGLIIPLEAADWGAQGVTQVTQAFQYVRKRYNSRLALLGYLVSRFKRARTLQRGYHQQLLQHFGRDAFDVTIPDLAAFERAVTRRIPVTIGQPRSDAADIARRFFDEVLTRTERHREGGHGVCRTNVHAAPVAGAF